MSLLNRTSLSAAALVLLAGAATVTAGPLNPPAGPVASSMKTLTDLEPRVAINAANTPGNASTMFRITAPGSYYLAGNIQGQAGLDVIRIEVSNVTLDLNGFTITGGANGVSAANCSQITVRDGNIGGCTQAGVRITVANLTTVRNLTVTSVGGDGIDAGYAATVTGCRVNQAGGFGFQVYANSLLTDCKALSCSSDGYNLAQDCKVRDCIADSNQNNGFYANGTGVMFTGCLANNNGVDGIRTGGYGMIEHCRAENNQMIGFEIGDHTELKGCCAEGCVRQGARVGSYCRIVGNTFRNNSRYGGGWAGLWIEGSACRVEDNESTLNGYGLYVGGTDNIIVKNSCRGNSSADFTIPAGNEAAPIITNPGSNNFATMTPWSNIAY